MSQLLIQLRFRQFMHLKNDRRNLSFVKYINIVGNKMTRNDRKMIISKSCQFFNRTDFSFVPPTQKLLNRPDPTGYYVVSSQYTYVDNTAIVLQYGVEILRGQIIKLIQAHPCLIIAEYIYRKVASRSTSCLVAPPRIFRLFMKGKFYADVL